MSTILVVDDEEAVRLTLCDFFTPRYACHAAGTVEQALLYLGVESYDAVLTDISMPGHSGLELLSHIRRRQPDTPVIVISGASYEQHAVELIKLGAFHYLVKPFDLIEVAETVARAVELRQRRSRSCDGGGPRDGESEESEADADEEVKRIEQLWAEAYRRNDAAALDRIWADEFRFTNPFGKVESKAEAMASVSSEVVYYHFSTFDVQNSIFDDTAVVNGRAMVRGIYRGRDVSGQYRYTNTYAKRPAGWQAIASHAVLVEGL